MTIHDYIKKHGLTVWRKWPDYNPHAEWMARVFTSRLTDGKPDEFHHDDRFEIYSNSEHTRFVSMNLTSGVFRIVHNELIVLSSEWQPTDLNFEPSRL